MKRPGKRAKSGAAEPTSERALDAVVSQIRACRVCRDYPTGPPLPHEPRPVLRVSSTARLGIFSQAPGQRVHASGLPFTDPSGVRLRQWMGVSETEFYDVAKVAIAPMGFCFPGADRKGGDLPPRPECAPLWRPKLMGALPRLDVVLLVGRYALDWHWPQARGRSLSDAVGAWREMTQTTHEPQLWPLPHPSWRNNAWLRANPWFEEELLPVLRARVRAALTA